MLRWLVRLLIVGAILGVGAFVAQKLLNQDDDFDDFDDFDESFEFRETPVEIEVPASDGRGVGSERARIAAGGGDTQSDGQSDDGGAGGSENTGPPLTDVKGIGTAFEARLHAIGINTMQDLAAANAESLNEQLDLPGGAPLLDDWISQAKELSS